MADLLTLEQAKIALRITSASFDAELALKIPQASTIILDYIEVAQVDLSDDQLRLAQVATQECLKALMFDEGEPLSDNVKRMLRRLRRPSLA